MAIQRDRGFTLWHENLSGISRLRDAHKDGSRLDLRFDQVFEYGVDDFDTGFDGAGYGAGDLGLPDSPLHTSCRTDLQNQSDLPEYSGDSSPCQCRAI